MLLLIMISSLADQDACPQVWQPNESCYQVIKEALQNQHLLRMALRRRKHGNTGGTQLWRPAVVVLGVSSSGLQLF